MHLHRSETSKLVTPRHSAPVSEITCLAGTVNELLPCSEQAGGSSPDIWRNNTVIVREMKIGGRKQVLQAKTMSGQHHW